LSHVVSKQMRSRISKHLLASLSLLSVLFLSACSPPNPTSPAVNFGHVHGIVDLGGGDILLGTHSGIYTINEEGDVAGPIGGNDFDAMGISGDEKTLYASGHPGPNTDAQLGTPNLGIIRSDDEGENWSPVSFTGAEDFHVLTVGPNNSLYGIGSGSLALRVSLNGGQTWQNKSKIEAVDLAATSDGALFAATPEGLLVSEDKGTSFTPIKGAPLLYTISSMPEDGLIGVDVNGVLWKMSDQKWQQFGSSHGTVQALLELESGAVALVDERGVVLLKDSKAEVLYRPASSP
jgi:hypothetical protein